MNYFEESTKRWIPLWREYERRFRAAAELAKSEHRGYFRFLRELFEIRNGARKRLHDDHGITIHVDPKQGRVWAPAELPEDPYKLWSVTGHIIDFAVFDAAISATESHRKIAGSTSEEVLRTCVDKALHFVLARPPATALVLGVFHPGTRAAALSALTGFVATKTSLRGKAGTRLRRALASDGDASLNTFLRRMSAALSVAWEEHANAPVVEAFDKARRAALMDLAVESPKSHGEVALDDPECNLQSLKNDSLSPEGLMLLEEGKLELQRKIDRAKLSRPEEEILQLRCEGFRQTEIASRVGLKVGTVGKVMHRIRQKLRRVGLSPDAIAS